jgi:hypothetical protein
VRIALALVSLAALPVLAQEGTGPAVASTNQAKTFSAEFNIACGKMPVEGQHGPHAYDAVFSAALAIELAGGAARPSDIDGNGHVVVSDDVWTVDSTGALKVIQHEVLP